jgi:hypothetical protein
VWFPKERELNGILLSIVHPSSIHPAIHHGLLVAVGSLGQNWHGYDEAVAAVVAVSSTRDLSRARDNNATQ